MQPRHHRADRDVEHLGDLLVREALDVGEDHREAVESLPENFRLAVLLADVEGFSYKEIAEILDIPIGTVMSRLHRGRRALQKRLYEFAAGRGLIADQERPASA